jgi:hypothetical protein
MLLENKFGHGLNEDIAKCLTETEAWLTSNQEQKSRLEKFVDAFEEIQFVTPVEVELSDWNAEEPMLIPPWVYLLHESDRELDAVLTSMKCGLYKDSLRGLRSFLELNLMSLYFFITKDRKLFTKWIQGNIETPSRSFLMKQLLAKNPNLKKLDQINWAGDVNRLYKELCRFIHTSGAKGSFLQLRFSNSLSFSDGAVRYILATTLDAIQLMIMGRIAVFPTALQAVNLFPKFGFNGPMMGWLDEWQVRMIKVAFDGKAEALKCLQEISDSDTEGRSRVEAIEKLDDLTEEEILDSLTHRLANMNESESEDLLSIIKDKPFHEVIAIIGARDKAFTRAVIPILNQHMLGLIK